MGVDVLSRKRELAVVADQAPIVEREQSSGAVERLVGANLPSGERLAFYRRRSVGDRDSVAQAVDLVIYDIARAVLANVVRHAHLFGRPARCQRDGVVVEPAVSVGLFDGQTVLVPIAVLGRHTPAGGLGPALARVFQRLPVLAVPEHATFRIPAGKVVAGTRGVLQVAHHDLLVDVHAERERLRCVNGHPRPARANHHFQPIAYPNRIGVDIFGDCCGKVHEFALERRVEVAVLISEGIHHDIWFRGPTGEGVAVLREEIGSLHAIVFVSAQRRPVIEHRLPPNLCARRILVERQSAVNAFVRRRNLHIPCRHRKRCRRRDRATAREGQPIRTGPPFKLVSGRRLVRRNRYALALGVAPAARSVGDRDFIGGQAKRCAVQAMREAGKQARVLLAVAPHQGLAFDNRHVASLEDIGADGNAVIHVAAAKGDHVGLYLPFDARHAAGDFDVTAEHIPANVQRTALDLDATARSLNRVELNLRAAYVQLGASEPTRNDFAGTARLPVYAERAVLDCTLHS